MTHSFSSSVLHSLLNAQNSGKHFDVICTESRPVNEGVELARTLGKAGIPVRLIPEAAVNLLLPETNLILVGADNISCRGLLNKIGTYLLALAGHAAKVDFYALCSTLKFLSPQLPPLPDRDNASEEVLAEAPPNVTPFNRYFETTPFNLCTGIVTEYGVLQPEKVLLALQSMPAHPALSEMLKP